MWTGCGSHSWLLDLQSDGLQIQHWENNEYISDTASVNQFLLEFCKNHTRSTRLELVVRCEERVGFCPNFAYALTQTRSRLGLLSVNFHKFIKDLWPLIDVRISFLLNIFLGSWMTTYLGKTCSFGLPRVPFVNCRQFMYLVISLLVLRAGCGIWLYQFLIIAYLFT